MMKGDLTQGPVMKTMLLFAVPMILGNLLQQCYNVADTLIVGRFLGPDALAAVGSAFTLMTFLTSILLGRAERKYLYLLPSHCGNQYPPESAGLLECGSDPCFFKSAGGNTGDDAGVPDCHILWYHGCVSL